MKKQILFIFLLFFTAVFGAGAQEYALLAPFGNGANATGGSGGTVVTVTTVDELETYCAKDGKYIILIEGTLNFSTHLSIEPVDKTIIGLPGSVLTNSNQDKDNSGILYVKGAANNVIFRNLTFKSAGAYDCDGWDNLCIQNGQDIWVDHCDFQDGVDGNFDNKNEADNITVTWCRFRYLLEPKAGGSGGTDDHRYTNLLGSDSSDAPTDGTFSFTWAYCWWDNGCVERMLRCRNAELHFISCYWNSEDAHYYIGPQNASAYVEGCYFNGLAADRIFYENYGGTNSCKFVDSYGSVDGVPADKGTVSAPTYDYTVYSYEDTKTFVGNETCGAGATLQVNATTGEVYSSCSPVLDTPSGFETTVSNTSVTIEWDAVENASGYSVIFCSPVVQENPTDVTALLNNDASTSGYYTLSSGDRLYTTASTGTSACAPADVTETVYRTGSANDFVLELVETTGVTNITFGGRSSGMDSNRTLESYSINGGAAQTDGISGQITAQGCTTEISISGLNLNEGDEIAFTFNGNVQLSYFLLTSEVSYECETSVVSSPLFTATGLSANTAYTYQVQALSGSSDYDDSSYSASQNVITDNSAGISSYELDCKVIQNNSKVEVLGVDVKELTLYSISGSKLKTSKSQNVDLSSCRPGVYVLMIKTVDNKVASRKIVKQ